MTSTFQQKVSQVASHARRWVRLHGIGWFVAVVCLTALTFGCLDYVVRFQDLGVRLIFFALFWLATLWSFGRFVVTAWRYGCSDLHAAQRIEQFHPQLRDRLSTAVAFAHGPGDDPTAGSLELRRAVIAETEAITQRVDFHSCINRRQPMRALSVAGMAVGVIGILGLLDGPSASLAARRLLVPWGQDLWPRRHVLQLTHAPTRLATGQDFEVALIDANGRLPDRVEVHYWFHGDEASQIQTHQMLPLGNKLVHRLANTTRGFRYRATGGDDETMPWIELTLVEPPRIVEKEMLLEPPAYTGLETRRAEGNFRALVGTRVMLRARTSKPLSAATLQTDTMVGGVSICLSVDSDLRGFSLSSAASTSWVLALSGSYGFRLVDQEGLDVGVIDGGDVDVVRDLPPTVSLKHPATDLYVTARAVLSLDAIVKDDLAIRSVDLHFERFVSSDQASGDETEETLPLWEGAASVVPEFARDGWESDVGVQRTVKYAWDLTQLAAMKPGEWIDFRVVAGDYRMQSGESVPRRLTIVSAEELEERIAQRQAEILAQIAETVGLQRETRTQTSELAIQVREAGVLDRTDIDRLQAAELNQRQVQQRLAHPSDGLAAQIVELIEQLKSNRIDSPELYQRLIQFRETIERLDETHISRIQHQLIDALKMARETVTDDSDDQRLMETASRAELSDLFAQAGESQRRVIESLESLLGQFARWDNYQRLAREVGRLRREQENVYGRTQELRVETLSKDPNDLTAQQRANLRRLTERQNDIALRFNALTSGMEMTRQRLLGDNPMAAATLADALDMVYQSGVGGLIRDVGQKMDLNQLGRAAEQQDIVLQQLSDLQDILANRRQFQLDRTIQQLRDAASQLEQIRSRQQTVQQQLDDDQPKTVELLRGLGRDEAEMADQVARLARRMRHLRAESAESTLREAVQKLNKAAESAGADDARQMQQDARQAQQRLDEAQRQIEGALTESQQAFRDERISRLRQTVSEFVSRQQRLLDETLRLDSLRPKDAASITPAMLQALRQLSSEQVTLGEEVADVAVKMMDVEAFAFVLQEAAHDMDSAGQLLMTSVSSEQAVQLQRQAKAGLQQVLNVLMDDVQRDSPAGESQSSDASRDEEEEPDTYLLAQLKLIRAMQVRVNEQTAAIEQASQPWNQVVLGRQQELVQRQRRLAELIWRLLGLLEERAAPPIGRPPTGALDVPDERLE